MRKLNKAMTRDEIKKDLIQRLKRHRYEHTLGVEYTAACLAMRYGADVKAADMAGLLHDCAKCFSSKEKIRLCESRDIPVSEFERQNPELLHAKLGASIAAERYGIRDQDILSAITWHTTGRPDMTMLEKIIFISDYIEPNRYKADNLDQIRALAFQDLDQCLMRILSDTIGYLATRDFVTDPMTQKTWEYYSNKLSI